MYENFAQVFLCGRTLDAKSHVDANRTFTVSALSPGG